MDNESNNSLYDALKQCSNISKAASNEAKDFLGKILKGIKKTNKIIEDTQDAINKAGYIDKNMYEMISAQMKKIQAEFMKTYIDSKREIEEKSNQTANFNITLFGRTMAGKSTLMETLTNGSGDTIGKGGQRTTRDIRSYQWNGITITDVPGIEAYDGENDDLLAEASALYADLIIFLITAGQPEKKEAEWLVKLKKQDKPLICICNVKTPLTLSPDDPKGFRLKKVLNGYQHHLESINITQIRDQFNKFIQDEIPNERVDIAVVNILAKYLSDKPDYCQFSDELNRISNFDYLEKRILGEVAQSATLYRKRCFLSIVDVPIFTQMEELWGFSEKSFRQYLLVEERQGVFSNWIEVYTDNIEKKLQGIADNAYISLTNGIGSFVEDNIESKNFKDRWKVFVENNNVEGSINNGLNELATECSGKITDFFKDLNKELSLVDKFSIDGVKPDIGINWRRINGWAGAISGAGGVIAGLILGASNPVGWVLGGLGLLFGLLSWSSKSIVEKKRKEIAKVTRELQDSVESSKEKTMKTLRKWYIDNIEKKLFQDAGRRFQMLTTCMLNLANSQRSLASSYAECHIEISKKLICNILENVNMSVYIDYIWRVARIPGKKILIITCATSKIPIKVISNRLGGREHISMIYVQPKTDESEIINLLMKRFVNKDMRYSLKKDPNGVNVCYIPNWNFSDEQELYLRLIQQITKTHIIKKK